jgi:hypothetical protein
VEANEVGSIRRWCAAVVMSAAAWALCSTVLATGSASAASPAALAGATAATSGGTWARAEEVAGTKGTAGINSVSCASAGNCSAGGHAYGEDGAGKQAVVVSTR